MKKILLIICMIIALSSCTQKEENPSDINLSVGENGVNLDVLGNTLDVNGDKVDMNIAGSNLTVDGETVDMKLGDDLFSLVVKDKNIEISDEEKTQYASFVQETVELNDCKTQFDQLIDAFGNDYSSCFASRKSTASCSESKKQDSKIHIAIVLDVSGSMNAELGGETMMDIAKEEVVEYIDDLDSDVGGAVFIYGHKGNSTAAQKQASCSGIEKLGDFSAKNALTNKIDILQANGWTPIDESLQKAEAYLESVAGPNDQKLIVLVSDGKETCDGNPVSTAKKIASKKNTYIDVIGFNVYGDAQSQLSQIAKNGNGKYNNVRSRADFQRVFADMQAFANEITCGASQASIQLRSAVDTLNTYFICDYMLHEEQVKVMTNMTPSCEDEIEDMMEDRMDSYSEKLEEIKEQAEDEIDSFEENIEEVIDRF